MLVARIDRDWINPKKDSCYRVGKEFEYDITTEELTLTSNGYKQRFRVLDDDDIPYYGGWLMNDVDGDIQCYVLAWAMRDAGCTIIEVKVPKFTGSNNFHFGAKWVREIA